MSEVLPRLSEAEQNILAITSLCKDIFVDCLELGKLLLTNYELGYWSACGNESFRDMVEQLGISYSYATRYMGVADMVRQERLTPDELYKIGMSKAILLLSCERKGELTEEVKAIAMDAPYGDLRSHLGYDGHEEVDRYIICQRCGREIEQIICPRCNEDILLKKGMIRSR